MSRLDMSAPSPPGHTGADRLLLARLLSPTMGEARADHVSSALIRRFGTLGACLSAPPVELKRILEKDSGACADRLGDLRALVLGVLRAPIVTRPIVGNRRALRRYVRAALAHDYREQLRTLYLDSRNGLILEEVAGLGTRDQAPAYPREIVRRALDLGASSLILVHNHPAGDPTPSGMDIQMTREVVEGADLFDIQVHDHLIVGGSGVFSFYDSGLLRPGGRTFREAGRGQALVAGFEPVLTPSGAETASTPSSPE